MESTMRAVSRIELSKLIFVLFIFGLWLLPNGPLMAQSLANGSGQEQVSSTQGDTVPPASTTVSTSVPKAAGENQKAALDRDDVAKLRSEIDTIKYVIYYGGGFLAFIVF